MTVALSFLAYEVGVMDFVVSVFVVFTSSWFAWRCYPDQLRVFYRAGLCDEGAGSLASGGDWHIMAIP